MKKNSAFSRHFKSPKFEGVKLARFLLYRTNSDEYVRIVEKIDTVCSTGVGDQHDASFRLCIKPRINLLYTNPL